METYTRNPKIIDGSIDDNQIMMHIEKGKYFGLNPVGKKIWDFIEQPRTLKEITDTLLSEFDVSREQCEQEVQIFLNKAEQYEIIVKK